MTEENKESSKPRIIHIDDDETVLDIVKKAFSKEDINLSQFTNKHDYLRNPFLEANLYILDRHFPKKKGSGIYCDDHCWRDLVEFWGQMFPEREIVLLSGEPPADKVWRPYKNIKEAMNKSFVFRDLSGFRDRIKSYLNINEA